MFVSSSFIRSFVRKIFILSKKINSLMAFVLRFFSPFFWSTKFISNNEVIKIDKLFLHKISLFWTREIYLNLK